ncbi:MAG: GvpL/GvpF family gas vesicle protein [Methylococcales bacterium]
MSFLLYGIINEASLLVIEPTFTLIKAAGIIAIAKACENEVSREPAVVLAYGEKVMNIHQQTTLIPMRYGSILADEEAVKVHLKDNNARYQARLAELNNCEEMGIRLLLEPFPDSDTSSQQPVSGLSYLKARKRAYAVPEKAEQQAAFLEDALSGLYRQHCSAISVFNGQQTYLLSYLVHRSNLPAFHERLSFVEKSITDLCSVSGPWPPYNFAN